MKFQRLKDMICGAVIASMVLCSGTVAFAKVANMNIPVSYSNIKVIVDGKQLQTSKEPFTYEGTTYLPIRAVAEAVGMNVGWDGPTKTVTLTSGDNSAKPEAPAVVSYSRNNPAPVGTAQKCTVSDYFDSYTAEIKITESYSGSKAWSKIEAANMFNDEAPSGKEYILVKVEAKVTNVKDDKAVDFSIYDFTPFNETNTEYEIVSVVEPDPQFGGTVYDGGTMKGYLAFLVDRDDDNPKVVFGEKYDGTGGVWFSLRK